MRLAVLGNLTLDEIDGRPPSVGGGAYHAGRALRLLDVPSVVVAKIGSAERPLVGSSVSALGIPLTVREVGCTARFTHVYDGDTRRTRLDCVGPAWTPDDVTGWAAVAIGRAPWVHVAALTRSDFPTETLAALARGRRILLDGQGLVRVPRSGPLTLDDAYDPQLLRHVTVLKLAEEEAQTILPDFAERSIRRLGVPEVLLTFGSRGSLVYADGRLERVRAHPVAADSTGAGDAYASAYLAGRASGAAPAASARRATSLVELLLSRRR